MRSLCDLEGDPIAISKDRHVSSQDRFTVAESSLRSRGRSPMLSRGRSPLRSRWWRPRCDFGGALPLRSRRPPIAVSKNRRVSSQDRCAVAESPMRSRGRSPLRSRRSATYLRRIAARSQRALCDLGGRAPYEARTGSIFLPASIIHFSFWCGRRIILF